MPKQTDDILIGLIKKVIIRYPNGIWLNQITKDVRNHNAEYKNLTSGQVHYYIKKYLSGDIKKIEYNVDNKRAKKAAFVLYKMK